MSQKLIKQHAQYTFKYNLSLGRHGWLHLTPAYSVHLVEEILSQLNYSPACVLEPFSGTGTTELVCSYKKISSLALELNPFLVWLGKTKLKIYPTKKIDEFISISNQIVLCLNHVRPASLPPIFNIERWWGNKQADFLARLKASIETIDDVDISDLLKIAFCRTVIELSNAAFNHVSTSFKDAEDSQFLFDEAKIMFINICKMIAHGASIQPLESSKILLHDSRSIPNEYFDIYDTVITSPPYPNRISYIRELRPYMYWMDYLKNAEQASHLDWNAIGGTWGKATSMLTNWKASRTLPSYVYDIAEDISKADNKSAHLMANYVLRYFEDINEHLNSIYHGLRNRGNVFYIVGNSSFYGITVPSERIYRDIMNNIGFINTSYKIVRKRNCNKQLYEFIITGHKDL